MEDLLGMGGEERERIDQTTVQVACDFCGMIGPVDRVRYTRSDDEGPIEFLVMEMDECQHGMVIAVKSDRVQRIIDKGVKIARRIEALQGSGDLCGLERSLRRWEAIQREVQKHMRLLWHERAEALSDWPTAPRLSEVPQ